MESYFLGVDFFLYINYLNIKTIYNFLPKLFLRINDKKEHINLSHLVDIFNA